MSVPRLLVLTCSTRPSRKGPAVAAWVEREARRHGGFEVEAVDLAVLALPLMDEPHHPKLARYTHDHTRAWSAVVDRADAVVLVFPEYNHSFTAPVKNALDYLHREWADKAVGLVSYGGASSGLRAAAALKPVLTCLRMVPAVEAVSAPFFEQFVDEDGTFVAQRGAGRQRRGDARRGGAADGAAASYQRARRGRGWHRGQVNDERFMNGSRRTRVPQRGHGLPSCP